VPTFSVEGVKKKIKKGEMVKWVNGEMGKKRRGSYCLPFRLFAFAPFTLFYKGDYFFFISPPQHLMVPVPPLVTITCELHFSQRYILPIWFAM
jgi:hypothetical protein